MSTAISNSRKLYRLKRTTGPRKRSWSIEQDTVVYFAHLIVSLLLWPENILMQTDTNLLSEIVDLGDRLSEKDNALEPEWLSLSFFKEGDQVLTLELTKPF